MASSMRFNEKALSDVIQQAAQRLADLHQQALDQVLAEGAGKPIDEIRARLTAQWAQVNGGRFTEPDLSIWAGQIAAGRRIELAVEPPAQ